MTASNHLTARKTLEWIEVLRATVRDTVAAEEKLRQDFEGRLVLTRKQEQKAIDAVQSQLRIDLAALDEHFQQRRSTARDHYAQRPSRIKEARKASQKRAAQAIEEEEGRRKYKLQMDTMQAKREHESGLKSADQEWESFKKSLATLTTRFEEIEGSARSAFGGYRKFVRSLSASDSKSSSGTAVDVSEDEYRLRERLQALLDGAESDLKAFRKRLIPLFFRAMPLWIVVVLSPVPLVPLLQQFHVTFLTYPQAEAVTGAGLVLGGLLHWLGGKGSGPLAQKISQAMASSRLILEVCPTKSEERQVRDKARIEQEYQARVAAIEHQWTEALDYSAALRDTWPPKIDEKAVRADKTAQRLQETADQRIQSQYTTQRTALEQAAQSACAEHARVSQEKQSKLNAEREVQMLALIERWESTLPAAYRELEESRKREAAVFLPWESFQSSTWSPPSHFSQAAKFAEVHTDLFQLGGGMPKDPRFKVPGPTRLQVPVQLVFPEQGSLLVETQQWGREEAIRSFNNILFRLLTTAPPGRLSFTILDPVGLGQSFAGVMHLADYAEHVIQSRIWTQADQIEQKLGDLNEHMEKVIQMYLRNEYATIAEYNEEAGNIAEKYHVLVVADFPNGFSETAIRRLLSIASSGARCGVYALIHCDRRQPLPPEFDADTVLQSAIGMTARTQDWIFTGQFIPGLQVQWDSAPPAELALRLVHEIGKHSRDSNRVQVPFAHVVPSETQVWTEETTQELRVPIGRTGATKLQYLAIGKGTRQHALLAGKTGSGKSTLFHVIITNLALWCSPEQVEFYLVDFKKGVEFKCYATHRLPHARVVAIESDREFGLSVLQRLDEELKRRGDVFRQLGVQDIPGYKRAGGTDPMPRCLLMIDEFQELFVEDDKVSQSASVLLDRIVRQGRAFGMHVILGSQTLGGAYTVARATLGQMVIRIALQCNEADAYLIMDENNPAPRLLSRPGEGIYNDSAGAAEGNSPFQAVWLDDEERDRWLERVHTHAVTSARPYPGPFVFEGDAPASAEENAPLHKALETQPKDLPRLAQFWLGAPNSIKGPTACVLQRQSGNHVLMIGQREEAVLSMFAVGLIGLAAQFPVDGACFYILDASASDTPDRRLLERVVSAIPHSVKLIGNAEIGEVLSELSGELQKYQDGELQAGSPSRFVFIRDLHKFKKLRQEEDFSFSSQEGAGVNPAEQLKTLITEGPAAGIHLIVSCDTYNNVNRSLSRKSLTEFEMRVLFQMSANDSASLIDTPKASTLGLHRAIYYNEQQGYLEVFRPYATPEAEWIARVAQSLKLRKSTTSASAPTV